MKPFGQSKNHEYDSIKVILLILFLIGVAIFIFIHIEKRNGNQAQVIIPLAGAVLPELLSVNIDVAFDGLYDTNNTDFHQIIKDLGLNSMQMFGGTNANLGHWQGTGLGFDPIEANYYEYPPGAKDREAGMTAEYDGSMSGIPATRFHDKFIDAVKNLRSTVAQYPLNVMTERAAGMPMTQPLPIDQPSLDAAINENVGLIQNLINQGVTVHGVQLCSECQGTNKEPFFPDVDYFSSRVGPIAQAIKNNPAFGTVRTVMHITSPRAGQGSDWGVSTDWNEGLMSATNAPKLWNYIDDIGTYLNLDDTQEMDIACNPATEGPDFDIFECFREHARDMLDVDMASVLDNYSSYFGTNHGIRIEEYNINNYDATADDTFTSSAFDNTLASAAYFGEYLFKLAQYNHTHNDIVKSASLMNFSAGIKSLVAKRETGTNDDFVPLKEMYSSYYTKNPLKYNSAGLAFRIVKDVFDGVHKVLDPFTFTVPSFISTGQLQVYGFQNISTNKKQYYFFNWSNQSVDLSAVKLNGILAVDPQSVLTLTQIKGSALSSVYGKQNIWNKAPFTLLTDNFLSPTVVTGTTNVLLPAYSITKIDGIAPSKFNTGLEVITGASPKSGSNKNAPKILGAAAAGDTVNIYTTGNCTGTPIVTGSGATFNSSGIMVNVLDNTHTTFYANTSANASCSTGFTYSEVTPDITAPTFSNITATPSDVVATITWTTSEPASSSIGYDLTIGSYTTVTPETDIDPRVTEHSITLTGLVPNTTYHYQLNSADAMGNHGTSSDKTFKTLKNIVTTPVIASSVPISGGTGSNNNYPKFKGDEAENSTVKLFTKDTCTSTVYGSGSSYDFEHGGIILTVAVADNSTTTFYANATDGEGNVSPCSPVGFSYQEITPDKIPPVITFLIALPLPSSALITWTTDEPATSVVNYGLTNLYGSTITDLTLTTLHSITINGLLGDTNYYYQVKSADAAGNSKTANGPKVKTLPGGIILPITPSIVSSTPPSNSDNNSPSLVGDAASGTTVKIYTSNICSGISVASGSDSLFASSGISVSVADNTTTTFYANATDTLGNVSACSTGYTYVEVSPVVDITKPNITFVGPPKDAVLSGTDSQITVTATDNISVTQVDFYYNNNLIGTDYSGNPNYSIGWNTTLVPNGTYTISAKASDAAGNKKSTVGRTITVLN